jgi:hypothetical protein
MGSMRPPDPALDSAPTSEVPPAIADAIDALARHRNAAARFDAIARTMADARVKFTAERAERALRAEERAENARVRREAAQARDDEARAHEAEADARATLRRAVELYARDLRRRGVPPERMIVAVKGVVRRAAASPAPLPEPERLIPDLVEWSVAAYFAAD